MADTFSKEQRSQIMRQVKSSRNKSTEIKLLQYFKDRKIIGWRRNYKLFGKPDFAFPKSKIVIFVDGCFWHGHNCRNTKPKDNKVYWINKIIRNKKRDRQVTKYFHDSGWRVIRLWECKLKDTKKLDMKIVMALNRVDLPH
jgi:DNA mismatch endonuclease, patch repair protein